MPHEPATPPAGDATDNITHRIARVRRIIAEAAQSHGRNADEILLLAVSKTHPASAVRAAYDCGIRDFGENYLQDALTKMDQLPDDIHWHFIGPLQSNKTRAVAERFAWVHTLDREKIARRLNDQRPDHLPPLNVCLQVHIGDEASKSGIAVANIATLARAVEALPRLRLRGLMCIPPPQSDYQRQYAAFRVLSAARDARLPRADTLSMGMSNDLEAAIAAGSTIVRIGTAIFGPRPKPPRNKP